MFSHITLGIDDFETAEPFYDTIMEILGHPVLFGHDKGKAWGEPTGSKLFIGPAFDGKAASNGNGQHTAFIVNTRAQVDAFHAAALAHGGSDEGAPGPRPYYHPNYYGAYVRDPEGNKLQAVCHRASA
jgi:catechol 2,3-dioxygenase-like lactoylglutathione lyase family enzyme